MDLPLLFASLIDLDLAPVAGITLVGVWLVSDLYFKHRKRELWHQTARLAIEKGQPIPAWPESTPPEQNRPRWRGYLLAGLINIAVGAGLFVTLSQIPDTSFNTGYFGCIPAFVGIALLLGAAIEAFAARR